MDLRDIYAAVRELVSYSATKSTIAMLALRKIITFLQMELDIRSVHAEKKMIVFASQERVYEIVWTESNVLYC